MSWRDPSTEGTYAYTGTLELEQLENVAMIMDPGLPKWVTSIARLSIPALIDIYAERMGRPLDTQPLVLFSYEPRSEEHTSELQSRGHLVCRLLLEKKNSVT